MGSKAKCPIMLPFVVSNWYEEDRPKQSETIELTSRDCMEHNCKLYGTFYTTEHRQVNMCAFMAMAMKNADGQIAV